MLLILEHISPEYRITRFLCLFLQPFWSWSFVGCQLTREPHLLIQSKPEFRQSWDVVSCEFGDVPGTSFLNPVRHVVALVARRRS
ncbi:unnamed protein product [Echinostoma caproni]|uniref:Uncharacterized protein n=1 Tax=Echinostoma caproni TaxID=27848 RepID=A0A3P8GVU1_9TREM|nr:unnamed protein product [Echinostoma caproni]